MRIKSLTLKNYRGFEDATIDFDPRLTVLVGKNGSGKSSVLEAVATILQRSTGLHGGRSGRLLHPAPTNVRRGAEEATCSLVVGYEGKGALLGFHLPPERLPATEKDFENLYYVPCIGRYDVATRRVAPSRSALGGRAYKDLDDEAEVGFNLAGKFESLFTWFKAREDVENAAKVQRNDLGHHDPELQAVRLAVRELLDGFDGLRIERDPTPRMVVAKDGEELEIEQLSDGERLLLAGTADLARRLSIAHRGSASPLSGEAILLVDEIELHLHPKWQRLVLPRLMDTFPNTQFIVTTHSPQVISEVPSESIRIVEGFKIYTPGVSTKGRDTNALLEDVFDTPSRPQCFVERIEAVDRLIDAEDYAGARAALAALKGELGADDHDVVGLETTLEFMESPDAPDPEAG